jgi:hypothetical protein
MVRYAMWQLDFANDLFVDNSGALGKSEICYDPNTEMWEYISDGELDDDDDQYSDEESEGDNEDSDSGLEAIIEEGEIECVLERFQEPRSVQRERHVCGGIVTA